MFGFIKKWFFTGLTFLLTFMGINSLSCISMNNEECKVRPQKVLLIVNLCFFFSVLKQVNADVVVTISMIHKQTSVFLMLLKISMLKCLI